MVVVKTNEKTCSLCSRKFVMSENPSGLVFRDQFFVCEDCCDKNSEEDMANWSKNIMQDPTRGMPIALWLIHQQNKDKTMMSASKKL